VLNYVPYHEDVFGSGGITPHILDICANGGEMLASRPGRFAPWEIPPLSI